MNNADKIIINRKESDAVLQLIFKYISFAEGTRLNYLNLAKDIKTKELAEDAVIRFMT